MTPLKLALNLLLLLSALCSGFSLESSSRGEDSRSGSGCSCHQVEGCIATRLGCIMWTGQGYPEGNILKQGQELMPDRAALISVLGSGKEIILISPSTPHAVLTAALSGPSSLLVVHHLRTACRDAVATLEAAGVSSSRVTVSHGLVSANEWRGVRRVERVSPPTNLAEWHTLNRGPAVLEEVPRYSLPSPASEAGINESHLMIVQLGPWQDEAVEAAIGACGAGGSACSGLVVELEYDGEGAVFGAGALRILNIIRGFEQGVGGHRCYWHMSDWASGEGQPWGEILSPVLDIVCLSRGIQTRPPEDVKVNWGPDVNRQLSAMLRAFAPGFAQKHTFTSGVINPAACLASSSLCTGPSNIRQFVPSRETMVGRAMTGQEASFSALATRIISNSQNSVDHSGCRRLVVFCYVNPGLAGHGAQAHEISQALSYAVASGRRLVVNDTCAWDLHPRDLDAASSAREKAHIKGFWETYMRPVSACSLPAKRAVKRPTVAGAEEEEYDGDQGNAILWDSVTAQLVSHAFTPSAYLERLIQSGRELFSPDSRFLLALHVRRGHKYIEIPPVPTEMMLAPVLSFLASALGLDPGISASPEVQKKAILKRLGGKPVEHQWATVAVASEDQLAIHQVQEMVRDVGATTSVIDAQHPRPNLRVSIPMACRLGILDPSRENLVSLISLFLFSRHADAFVGSFSSGYSRLVLELSLVTRRYRMPHHSLDVPFSL